MRFVLVKIDGDKETVVYATKSLIHLKEYLFNINNGKKYIICTTDSELNYTKLDNPEYNEELLWEVLDYDSATQNLIDILTEESYTLDKLEKLMVL